MKVVFISNYLNHHQIPFSDAMYRELKGDYIFIQTIPMEDERKGMGWIFDDSKYSYLKKSYEQYEQCMQDIRESDIAIIGSAEDDFIAARLKEKKVVVRYSERIYKNGLWHVFSPKGFFNLQKKHGCAKAKNMYMLCASGYAAGDWRLQGLYRGRMYKWGYFPKFVEHNIETLMNTKRKNKQCEIVWCGRFISWKHPETVLQLAESLVKENKSFHITMIGSGGVMRTEYEDEIHQKGLEKRISIIGPLSPDEVRGYMERANIFLMTSDYNEGWGAVVNEAMNSGCAVVASHAVGCVPFLIKENNNGKIYKSGNNKQLYNIVKRLITNIELCERLGKNAYNTICNEWNADYAASAAIELFSSILSGEGTDIATGPCSKAEAIFQWQMYHQMIKKGKTIDRGFDK